MRDNILIALYVLFAFGMGLLSNYISERYNLDHFGVSMITLALITPLLVYLLEKTDKQLNDTKQPEQE